MISIVTVTYNSSETINKLLKSLTIGNNLKYIDKLIIVENDSPDQLATKKICETFSSKINLKYILNSNIGFGGSCNLGASYVNSRYILFLNPDTELLQNSLEVLINHHIANKANITGGKAIDYQGNPHRSVVRGPNFLVGAFEFTNLGKLLKINSGTDYFYYEKERILFSQRDESVECVSGAYLLINNLSFQKLDGFDKKIFMYLEDVDLCVRATKMNMKVQYCPHSEIKHIGGASSKNKYHISHNAWYDSRKYYFIKHFDVFQNIFIQTLFLLDKLALKIIRKT